MSESSTIAEPMSDNQALREILGQIREINDATSDAYDAVNGINQSVTDVEPLVRAAAENIVKTVVTNSGGSEATIIEDNVVVFILPPKQTWVSPTAGKGTIRVTAVFGAPTVIDLATYTKG